MQEYVKAKHSGQERAGGVPAWHHVVRVGQLLNITLTKNSEVTPSMLGSVTLAGYGHDLLEDTSATKEEIIAIAGEAAYELIFELTNEWGDEDVMPYVDKMIRASEEARLIKLADLYDNMTNVTYTIPLLGTSWVHSFFLPTVVPMFKEMSMAKFELCSRTGSELQSLAQISYEQLLGELERTVEDIH